MTTRILLVLFASLSVGGCRSEAPAGSEREAVHHDEEDEDDDHAAVVQLSPEAVRAAALEFGEARPKVLLDHVEVPARLTVTQKGVAKVTPRVTGRVAKLLVQQGDQVRRGETLAIIESQALGQTRASYLAAAVKVRVALANFEREVALVEKGISAEREMRVAEAELAAARADLNAADAHLHALGLTEEEIHALKADDHFSASFPARTPIAGRVIEVAAMLGQSVEGTSALFTVADLATLWAMLDVSERQLPLVREGLKVTLTLPALPGKTVEGLVDYVGAVVEPATRTIEVRLVVPNPDGRLKPGMFGTARIASALEGDAASLVVPRPAVQSLGHEQVVFVPDGEGVFRAVEVEVGRRTPDEVEIVKGLEPGTRVVTTGAFVLKSELSKESLGGGHSH